MPVQPFVVGRGLDHLAEYHVLREAGGEGAQVRELPLGMLSLDHVPVRHAGRQLVDLVAEHFDGVLPVRGPARIYQRRRRDQEPRHPGHEPACPQVLTQLDDVFRPAHGPGRDRGDRTALGRELRRRAGAQVDAEAGYAQIVGVNSVVELLWPRAGGRHVPQLGDVDRGQHGGSGQVLLAVVGLDADAAPAVQHEPGDELVAEHRAAVALEVASQGGREPAGSAFQDRPAALLPAEDERVGEQAGARHVDGLVGLERHPEHEGAHVAAAELMPDDVPGRQHAPPLPHPPARVLG